jgi:hypothetical protein
MYSFEYVYKHSIANFEIKYSNNNIQFPLLIILMTLLNFEKVTICRIIFERFI